MVQPCTFRIPGNPLRIVADCKSCAIGRAVGVQGELLDEANVTPPPRRRLRSDAQIGSQRLELRLNIIELLELGSWACISGNAAGDG